MFVSVLLKYWENKYELFKNYFGIDSSKAHLALDLLHLIEKFSEHSDIFMQTPRSVSPAVTIITAIFTKCWVPCVFC